MKKHEHDFKPVKTKVSLLGGRKKAVDVLSQFKCSCGKIETLDILERRKL